MSEELTTTALKEEEFNKKVDMKVWKRLLAYGLRQKKLLIPLIVFMFIVAAIDLVYPQLSRYAIDSIIMQGDIKRLIPFAAVYFIVIALQSFGTVMFISRAGKLEMAIAYDIRQDAFKKLQELSFSYYDKTAVGYIMARMIGDIPRLSDMIAWSHTDILWSGGFVIGCTVMMLSMNWKLALLVLIVVPPIAILCAWFQKRILQQHRIVRKQNSRITGAFNEGIMGAVTTKTLVREERNFEEFKAESGKMRKASIRAAVLSAMFTPIVMTLGSVGTALALYAGGRTVIAPTVFGAAMTIGVLSTFISYTTNLFDPIQQLAGIFAEMQSAQASAERVVSLLDTESDIRTLRKLLQNTVTA